MLRQAFAVRTSAGHTYTWFVRIGRWFFELNFGRDHA